MIDSVNSPDNYKTLKQVLGHQSKILKCFRFVCNHLKTRKMYKNAVKYLPFKIQVMCDKVILENDGRITFV